MSEQLNFLSRPPVEPTPERVLFAAERPRFRRRGNLSCASCWGDFEGKRHTAVYCSDACRAEAHRATKRERMRRHEEARKRMGLKTAAENNRVQRTIARWAALMALDIVDEGIASDVREWCSRRGIELEWEKPWTGSLFQCGWFVATGRTRAAYHKGSSARHVREWRLSSEGVRVLGEIGK